MKKLTILVVVMLIIGLLAGCWTTPGPVTDETEAIDIKVLWGVYDLTGYNSNTVNSVMARYDTPQKIVAYMAANFSYQDHSAAWSPYNFYKYKWGDCNDFSTYAIYCAYKVAGISKYNLWQIYVVYTNGKSHMLAMFDRNPGVPALQYSSSKYYYDSTSFIDWVEVVKHHDNQVPETVRYADFYDYDLNRLERWYF